MKSIICLALSCLLVGLLYVFMRQQFAAQDRKISDLTQLVASVVAELQHQMPPAALPPPPLPLEVKRMPERVTVSDDSESEGDTESDSESEGEESGEEDDDKKVEAKVEVVKKAPEEVKESSLLENAIELDDISIVLDLSEGTKTINLFDAPEAKPNYDKWTVKDLKDLVSKHGGPASLKTKMDLIDFLEKK